MAKKPKLSNEPAPSHLLVDERFITAADRDRRKVATTDTAKMKLHADITARAMSEPAVRAAAAIQELQGDSLCINSLVDELRQQVAEVQLGNLKRPEAMLVAQAHTLDALFSHLVRRSHGNSDAGYLNAADTYMRLALKAQAQTVRTIEALGELKNPRPVAYVRQANIAHTQQVNNGMPSQAGEFGNQQSKLSGEIYELPENNRTPCLASTTYPSMETLGTLDRAEVPRG
jgi:hypothetical protein